jgi:hypothetical protein
MSRLVDSLLVSSDEASGFAPGADARESGAASYHRLRVRPDGRCALRAVVHAAGVADCRVDDTLQARIFLQEVRIAATDALVAQMERDCVLSSIVHGSFPDEMFDTFDSWLSAQRSDDCSSPVSSIWQGGGEWLLYALAHLYGLKIVVHNVDRGSLSLVGPADGTVVVDARPDTDVVQVAFPPGAPVFVREVHLASMHNEDGTPDHFDIMLLGPRPGADPVGRQRNGASSHGNALHKDVAIGLILLVLAATICCLCCHLAPPDRLVQGLGRHLFGSVAEHSGGGDERFLLDTMVSPVRVLDPATAHVWMPQYAEPSFRSSSTTWTCTMGDVVCSLGGR